MNSPMSKKISLMAIAAVVLVVCTIWALRSVSRTAMLAKVPAYYEQPPGDLPAVLGPQWFTDSETRASYEAASSNRPLFSQLPCYCYCDRSAGHKSLLSCFTDAHGSQCSICRREALFAASESRRGRSAARIRDEIIRGLWTQYDESLDLKKTAAMSPEVVPTASH